MKICIFSRTTFLHCSGGMENHLKTLAEGLAQKGHEITVITSRHPENERYLKASGVEYYFLKWTKKGMYSLPYFLLSASKFRELHKKINFDVVVSQSVGGYKYAHKLLKKFSLPFVAINHGTALNEIKSIFNAIRSPFDLFRICVGALIDRFFYFYLLWERITYKKADAVIAPSSEISLDLIKQYNLKPYKVFTVFNGIDPHTFKPDDSKREAIRRRYNISADEKVILMLGRIEKMKGFQFGIRAFSKIISKNNNVKLLIAGSGSYEKNLKKLAKSLGIEQNVVFCGQIDNKSCSYYYNACDICLSPSLHVEAFPTVIIEAMACGKPAVAGNLGGSRSAIDHGKNGFLVKSTDPDDIAAALLKILGNKSFAEELSKNALSKAKKFFTIDKMISGTENVLKWPLQRRLAAKETGMERTADIAKTAAFFSSSKRSAPQDTSFSGIGNLAETLLKFRSGQKAYLSLNKASKFATEAKGPKFLLRVDDFPRWDIDTTEFQKFHELLRSHNIPYLLGVTPNICLDPLDPFSKEYRELSGTEAKILKNIEKEGVQFALHGFTHQTLNKNFNTELISMTEEEMDKKIQHSLSLLKGTGIKTDIFIPPFNTVDLLSFKVLSKHFKVVCGGPESVEFLGPRITSYINETLYVPSYEPAYEKADRIIKFVEKIKNAGSDAIVPLSLHWSWELKNGYKNLKELAVLLSSQNMIEWAGLL